MTKNYEKIPKHLPKRLTISFPFWCIYDREGGPYFDYDKFCREHIERGFNCVRIDDGAGLIHDIDGNRMKPLELIPALGEYHLSMRRMIKMLDTTEYLLDNLIRLFTAAKKHGLYIILSSWYYLHTYWMLKDKSVHDYYESIPPYERFMHFAKLHNYIIQELRARDLHTQIAFVEIFNEADGLSFTGGYANTNADDIREFTKHHNEAIEFLKSENPDIMFAYDSYTPYTIMEKMPENINVFNFHSYFMWNIYRKVITGNLKLLIKENPVSLETLKAVREGLYPLPDDWYERIWAYVNIEKDKFSLFNKLLHDEFINNFAEYKEQFDNTVEELKKKQQTFLKDIPFVCGEGVSYIGKNEVTFEEDTPEFWDFMKYVFTKYKELGLWGSVVRTCCGPNDPIWHSHKDELLKLNKFFLED